MDNNSLGFQHFIANADGVALTVLGLMVCASLATWYLILAKGVAQLRQRTASRRFLAHFWGARTLEEVANQLRTTGVTDPYAHLVHHGFSAVEKLRGGREGTGGLIAAVSGEEFLTRALKRAIEQDKSRLEYGLALLASVASSAPFVGLFGTVWGIYHALIAIGASGQGTLDKVAGPVGEALIMTGIGLAVAIPAALAYNFFARQVTNTLSSLNAFAYDVFALLSTGIKTQRPLGDVRATSERVISLVQAGNQ